MPSLCFLIPSRKDVPGLIRMVRSLREHPDSGEIEIRVWFDDDDFDSLRRSKEVESYGVIIHTGPRKLGYSSTGEFITEMANETKCPWVTTADDDTWLEGPSFIDDLLRQPRTGVYCTPEIYALNNSHYSEFYQYWIVPNGAWKAECEVIQNPTDLWMNAILVDKRGWKYHRLKGLVMHHEWNGTKSR